MDIDDGMIGVGVDLDWAGEVADVREDIYDVGEQLI